MIVAIGTPSAVTRPVGNTVSVEGATPNEQVIIAPDATVSPTIGP
jgi:hypothetical protein